MKCDELTIYDDQWCDKSEVDDAIAELKDKLHDIDNQWNEQCKEIAELKAKLKDAYATVAFNHLDAVMRERRLKRALWVTRTAMAKSEKDRWNAHVDCGNRRNRKDPAFIKTGKLLEVSEWRKLWADIERKCLKMAEEFGG